MKVPSPLGAAIEAAIARDTQFSQHREPVQYLCCSRTTGGRVFAYERVTSSQITLWLPEDAAVRSAAEKEGLKITKSVPFPNREIPKRYGRLSSLNAVPELCDAALHRIAVTSVGQAIAVVEALA